ncbi:hypothetical protein ACPPVT_22320 [Angustibacter sp. McL0619]|uniref:hypothetical protein n=1 Tax=Angustibacter sp. McL0619 TaxID=3415676 RepID=UPI003CEF79E3
MAKNFRHEHVRDQGGIVVGWLSKLAIGLAIIGVLLFDVISVVTAKMSVEDQGATAALNASDIWARTHDDKKALETAQQTVSAANPTNVLDVSTFHIDPDGTVHLRISRQAPTLVAHYVGRLREISDVSADAFGRSTT